MMIAHHLIRTNLISILHYTFSATIEVNIYISWCAHIRIGIEQCVTLPFQDTVAESCILEVLANLCRIHIQANILLLNPLRHSHPCHQQVSIRSQFFWQLLNSMKQYPYQCLFLAIPYNTPQSASFTDSGIPSVVAPMQNRKNQKYSLLCFHCYTFASMKQVIRLILSYIAAIILLPIALLYSLYRRK